ncbi:MAG: hypothetical protein HQL07_14625 [Nitrospirae bacterium]|nr:hypothetical protein [Magnetococcales bacterium]HAT48975.1 hypothetical protein [Alphaproteobacteria bacterium]
MMHDIYSKREERNKRKRGELPDIYQYDEIPKPLRVQSLLIIEENIENVSNNVSEGHNDPTISYLIVKQIHDALCREYGVLSLTGKKYFNYEQAFGELVNFVIAEENYERVLDVIEISLGYYKPVGRKTADSIAELNDRFKEAGVGYQYESGQIVRIDSQYIHANAVKPALGLLADKKYDSVNQEFLAAHEHYRHKRYEESINDCLKSFESLLKTICLEKGWDCGEHDTAKKLIQIVLSKGLIPTFMENQLNTMQTLLGSGVPTARNKLSGHGQGTEIREIPDYMASYVLHLTASTILLLGNAASQ